MFNVHVIQTCFETTLEQGNSLSVNVSMSMCLENLIYLEYSILMLYCMGRFRKLNFGFHYPRELSLKCIVTLTFFLVVYNFIMKFTISNQNGKGKYMYYEKFNENNSNDNDEYVLISTFLF